MASFIESELARLRAIVALERALAEERDLPRVAACLLDTCLASLPVDRAAFVLEPLGVTVTRGAGESGVWVLPRASGEPYLGMAESAGGVRSVIAVPLAGDGWQAAIQLDAPASAARELTAHDVEHAVELATAAVTAIDRAVLVRRLAAATASNHTDRFVRELPVGVLVLDARGRCTFANDWCAMRPGLALRAAAAYDRGGQPVRLDLGDGRAYTLASRALPDGTTAVVLAEAPVDRRVALTGELAADLAHELNNLLHVVVTTASLLEEDAPDRAARDDAHQIVEAAASASELARRLRAHHRWDVVEPRVVELVPTVRRLEAMLRRTIGKSSTVAVALVLGAPQRIVIDPVRLEQIVIGLVLDARVGLEALAMTIAVEEPPPGRSLVIELTFTGARMPDLTAFRGLVLQARGTIESAGSTCRLVLPAE